jgi:stage II sporulation protein Q
MKGYKLKKPAYFLIFTVIFVLVLTVVYAVDVSFNKKQNNEVKETYTEVPVYEDNIPVITTDIIINRPYVDSNVKILKGFYDHNADESSQENSIIYYESTYMQNTSIAYGGVESFDVVSILDGKVVKITKDDLVGNVIEVEHDNNIISVYQSVDNIKVNVNDEIKQGQIIATSGKSNINKDLNSHLLFELIINNQISNPEDYFGKKLNTINE